MKDTYEHIIRSKTILLAEDDIETRESIAKILKLIVKDVYLAGSGDEAYQVYLEKSPDIIISDINMPIMNGIEFVKKVREKDFETPVVMLTAHTDTNYLLDAVKLMLTDYVVKPIDLDNLVDILRTCVNTNTSIKDKFISLKNGAQYNMDTKELLYNKEYIKLGAKEIKLLDLLISNSEKTVSQQEIADHVWVNSYVSEGALKTIVSKIRNKIGKENIKTVKGMGYKIELNGE